MPFDGAIRATGGRRAAALRARIRAARARRLWRLLLRTAPTAALAWLCVYLLGDRLTEIEWREVTATLGAMPIGNIALALVFAAFSHLALASYDILAFRRLGRRVPWPRALKGGFAAGSFAQTLGLGGVTGTVARMRIYRANDVSAGDAIALTGLAALGFFSGLVLVVAGLTVFDPGPAALLLGASELTMQALSIAVILLAFVAARWAGRRRFTLTIGAQTIVSPGARWLTAATALTAADVLMAGLCLHMLLPAGYWPDMPTFLLIFAVATGLGLLIGSPGAVGPIEAGLLLALPNAPLAEVAAAALAFRAIYYLPFFAVAATMALRARPAPATRMLGPDDLRARIDWTVDVADDAEAELAALGDKHVFMPVAGGAFAQYGICGRIWLVMGDPVGPLDDWPWLIDGLEAEARAAGATLAVYKTTERSEAFWRDRGHGLWPLGEEGVVDPSGFSLDGSARRELRRKVRKAGAAGVEIRFHEPTEAPLDDLASVAADWLGAHDGREQGFSMGVWSRRFVRRHPVFSAWKDGRAVAFISVWVSGDGREWMLDLMRQRPDAPSGAMHALVATAIEQAGQRRAERFNLCMAPLSGLAEDEAPSLYARLADLAYRRLDRWHGLSGMRRFKETFRPEWRRRCLAAPNALAAAEALIAARLLVRGAVAPDTAATPRSPIMRLAALDDGIWHEEDLDELAREGGATETEKVGSQRVA